MLQRACCFALISLAVPALRKSLLSKEMAGNYIIIIFFNIDKFIP